MHINKKNISHKKNLRERLFCFSLYPNNDRVYTGKSFPDWETADSFA
ncbi:hypothetical protein B425_2543 [Bacillus amyloliquefaciens]|nr:hypothetical protein B425_2543 [Bacillus amyloliquefaciens]